MNKSVIRLLSTIFPKMTANIAYKTLTNPQVRKLRAHELEILNKSDQEKIKFGAFDIQTYKWGNPKNESILLIHGWEGQAGNFSDLIEVLLEHDYYVIGFDAPSHGFSSRGETSLFEFSDLVAEMIIQSNCRKLISHSFGGVATTYGLFRNQNLEIDKYVLLTTPDKFSQRIDTVVELVGVTQKVKHILINRLERELNVEVATVNVSNFVKSIPVKKALIIHDKNDKVIPLTQSKNVFENWNNCELEVIEGTGHFRILRTEAVLRRVVEFIDG